MCVAVNVVQLRLSPRQNAKSCQNEYIKLIDVLAQRWTIMCLIMLTVNCQAICETCPQCDVVPLPHLTNTVVLCRLQLITLTTVSFSDVLYQQYQRWTVLSHPMYVTSCSGSWFFNIWIYLFPVCVVSHFHQCLQHLLHWFSLLLYHFSFINSLPLWGVFTPTCNADLGLLQWFMFNL